jgi:hypothetical protein
LSCVDPTKAALDADDDSDVCDDAEDFLQFLSGAGFMAAGKRSSLRRESVFSGSSSDRRTSGRPDRGVSGVGLGFELCRPSPCIVDSRRTSLAIRCGSSGVIPPILQESGAFITHSSLNTLEHESPLHSPLEYKSIQLEQESPQIAQSPEMQLENNFSKFVSTLRMSSDFSMPHPSITTISDNRDDERVNATREEDENVFHARKTSSIDFSEVETLIAQARNPVLTQLHKAYILQFAAMATQIASLTRELAKLKTQLQPTEQASEHIDEGEEDNNEDIEHNRRFDRQISLDVASTVPSETPTNRMSRQMSRPASSHVGLSPIIETPFWKISLAEEGEDWDLGAQEQRRLSMRCISPMTMY